MLDMYTAGTFAFDATDPRNQFNERALFEARIATRVPPVRGHAGAHERPARPSSSGVERDPGHEHARAVPLPGLTPLQRGPTRALVLYLEEPPP